MAYTPGNKLNQLTTISVLQLTDSLPLVRNNLLYSGSVSSLLSFITASITGTTGTGATGSTNTSG